MSKVEEYEKRHATKGEAQSQEDATNIDKLGIAYTPKEIVSFMVKSIGEVLKDEFNTELGAKNVEVTDPFTGTGRFLTEVVSSALISDEDLERKYKEGEINGQEILPESHAIAKAEIERTYEERMGRHEEFKYLKLGDTFQDFEDRVDITKNPHRKDANLKP